MEVLNFAAETDWYITPQLIARRFYINNACDIHRFYNKYRNMHLAKYSIAIDALSDVQHLIEDCLSDCGSKLNFTIGLIDEDDTVGLLWAKFRTDLNAEIHCQVLDDVGKNGLTEALSWFVDHLFYQLHMRQLSLYVTEDDYKLDGVLHSLGFKRNVTLDKSSKFNETSSALHVCYFLCESEWINCNYNLRDLELDKARMDTYLKNTVTPYFNGCISAKMCATIVDYNYETILATNESAKSIGLHNWQQLIGAAYKYYARIDTAIWYFGEWYNSQTKYHIHRYARKIFRIQQYVFKTGLPASFIDSLPYDKGIRSYLVTFTPVFDDLGNVIAIQSVALNHRLASYQEHVTHIITKNIPAVISSNIKLSNREDEVLFLLICGITQEQIAQILNVKRATVAAIIRNQISVKLGVSASNTKLIIEAALALGFPQSIPSSLWAPSVITLDEALTKWFNHHG